MILNGAVNCDEFLCVVKINDQPAQFWILGKYLYNIILQYSSYR